MYSLLLVVLNILTAFEGNVIAGASPEKSSIVGGKIIDISEAPHMVSLLYYNNLICGGSIIDEYTILTAAHCLSRIPNLNKLSVRCGSSFHAKGGKVYYVKSIKIHDKYRERQCPDYDTGLIRLRKRIKFGRNVKPIPLAEKPPKVGAEVRVSGWGDTKVYISKQLQAVEVDIVDWSKCKEAYEHLTPRMICAARLGKDSCSGDSGGGMDYNGTVVGIVSFGNKCAVPNYPGVYTNVADPEILEFIKRNLN